MCSFRTFWTLAIFLGLVGCTGVPSGIEPVKGFDVSRYAGTWYEIMRLDHSFEEGLTNVTATYTLRDDGTVGVLNRGYDPAECGWSEVEGTATFQEASDLVSLSVTFFWPFAGGYHVFHLDRDAYRYALVSGPTRDYLWILARSPDLDEETLSDLVSVARRNGFDTDELLRVSHDEPSCQTS